MKHCKLFAALIALLVVACEDELVPKPEASEKIGYSVSVNSNGWQAGTRSADSLRMPRITIEPLEQKLGGKPVYLHTVVENTIPDNIKTATDSSAAGTRGSIVKTGDVTDLSVSAYVSNSDTWSDEDAKLYMQNVKSTSPNWSTNYFWPTTQSFIRFFAYSPAAALENGLTTTAYLPTFSYTVNNNIQAQADLLVASAQYDGNYCQPAHLEFGHALTAVTIKLKDMDQFTIKSLTLSGVKKSGTYTYEYSENGDSQEGTATHDAGAWTETGEANASYTYYFGTDADNKLVVATEQGELSGYTYTTGAGEVTLNAGELTLLLMPQMLTADAQITVTGTDILIDKEVNLTAAIGVDSEGNSKTWEKGKHVTYTLSLKDQTVTYVFNVEPDTTTPIIASSVPWYGATGLQYKVTDSYKIITRGNNQSDPIPVEWKVTYPSWVDETTIPGGTLQDGIVSNSDKSNAKVGTYGVVTIEHTFSGDKNQSSHETLKWTWISSSEDKPYDLSTENTYDSNTTPQNTANCYIVKTFGYYTFPLVYGNAYEKGVVNEKAYMPGTQQGKAVADILYKNGTVYQADREIYTNVLPYFVDHTNISNEARTAAADNSAITQPWIVQSKGGKYIPHSAEIVWQDEPCLLTEVKLNESKDYICFRIREDCMCEGNALVAVREMKEDGTAGPIMWSWHIWVTDGRNRYDTGEGVVENFFEPLEVNNRIVVDHSDSDNWKLKERTFKLMRAHIGHCDGETKIYSQRTGSISFVQVDNGEEITPDVSAGNVCSIGIVQGEESAHVVTTPDNAVYYQYGRKDPMIPGVGDGKDKPVYDTNRKPISSEQMASKKVGREAYYYGEAIQHPDYFFSRNQDNTTDVRLDKWCEAYRIYNLWNANNNILPMFTYFDSYESSVPANFFGHLTGLIGSLEGTETTAVIKTVYDPCPPGFEMPRIDAFTGFTFDGLRRGNFFNQSANQLEPGANVLQETITAYGSTSYTPPYPPFNGLSFFATPMLIPTYYYRGDDIYSKENLTFFVQALGHRRNTGEVAGFNTWGAALTASLICAQWIPDLVNVPEEDAHFFQLETSRLMFNLNGWSSLRPISTSDLDLAFGVMPAKTGSNPVENSATFSTVSELAAKHKELYPEDYN